MSRWLQLAGLSSMTQPALTDLIRELCSEVGIHDPNVLPAAVRKLKRVVAAVPPLEDFVKRVCDVVGSRGGGGPRFGAPGDDAAQQYLESVLGVVLQWAHTSTRTTDSGVRLPWSPASPCVYLYILGCLPASPLPPPHPPDHPHARAQLCATCPFWESPVQRAVTPSLATGMCACMCMTPIWILAGLEVAAGGRAVQEGVPAE
jgi:hypothetical protein